MTHQSNWAPPEPARLLRPLAERSEAYQWAPSTAQVVAETGLDPHRVLRFDANVPPGPPSVARPEVVARALAGINDYAHGGYPELVEQIARYCGVEPGNVVLGAGADDLIMLTARSFAGPGDRVSIAYAPTYPVYATAARVAGATVGDEAPAVTFVCRPHNPTGGLPALPSQRPLVVDEAYVEYAGVTVADRLDDGIVVLRTFSKAFGLAGARVGYALAAEPVAAELRNRQAPLPVSAISAALALAALREPPDVAPVIAERERVAVALAEMGRAPLTSCTNFLFVPLPEPTAVTRGLRSRGLLVRPFADGIRLNVRNRADDDVLLRALAGHLAAAG